MFSGGRERVHWERMDKQPTCEGKGLLTDANKLVTDTFDQNVNKDHVIKLNP